LSCSQFAYELLYMNFYPYVNLALYIAFIYEFITYVYGFKSVCNYLWILHADILHKDLLHVDFTCEFFYR